MSEKSLLFREKINSYFKSFFVKQNEGRIMILKRMHSAPLAIISVNGSLILVFQKSE